MHPYFHFPGRDIPAYGLLMVLAFSLAVSVTLLRTRRKGIPASEITSFCLMGIAGAVCGGVFLYGMLNIPVLVQNWDIVASQPSFWDSLGVILSIFSGIFYYGAFIGGLAAMFIYSRKSRAPFFQFIDCIAPALPIAHAVGRIGCLLGGCCYGVEVRAGHPLSIVYPPESLSAPPGVPLLAVPLIEASCNVVIGLFLLWFARREHPPGRVSAVYMMLYAFTRFILEFFRGDAIRGIYAGFSTSQYISVLVGGAGLALFLAAPGLRRHTGPVWDTFLAEQERLRELKERWKASRK